MHVSASGRWNPLGEGTSYTHSSRVVRSRLLRPTIVAQQFPEPTMRRPSVPQPPPPRSAYPYPQPSGPMPPSPPPPPPPQRDNQPEGVGGVSKALIAAAFVAGLGAGVFFDSEITLQPTNVASTELIDRKTPNSELCMAYGYSAMVFDQRIFVSFNPFNVYVSQPEVKPGCVLRQSNFNVLENRALISDKQVDTCKRSMNTFAFVGDLNDSPQISCVYHSEEAENQYLYNPKKQPGLLAPGLVETAEEPDVYSID